MDRAQLLARVGRRLERRQLVWFGTRGDDVEALTDLPHLSAAFSIIAPYRRRSTIDALALETLTGRRVDLDAYEIDDDLRTDEVKELRRALLTVLSAPSALVTYRPSTLVSAVCFARRDRCRYIGLFKDHQAAFEHKPWVESEVAALGIAQIPWTYIADEDQLTTLRVLERGPVMLRRSRTNGGVGIVRLDRSAELAALWPEDEEAYASVAPFIADALPVNVGAVVWHDGVTLHHPSVQLIGVPELTRRPFGYCGNDFGAAADLADAQLEAMDEAVLRIGGWLGHHGYRGAFGVDFLVTPDGEPLFTEVNPRFQGSTHASCHMSIAAGESCLMLEHIAALLGLAAPPSLRLRDVARNTGEFAHLVVHSTETSAGFPDAFALTEAMREAPQTLHADVVAEPGLTVDPGATVARLTVRDRVTDSGFELRDPWGPILRGWSSDTGFRVADGATR